MATQVDLARGWIQKGDSDRLNAERTVHSTGPYDTACFHCQQAVEKYQKAVLAFAGKPIPRTHDLEEIYNQCLGVAPALNLERMELANLRRSTALRRRFLARPGNSPRSSGYRQSCAQRCPGRLTLRRVAVSVCRS